MGLGMLHWGHCALTAKLLGGLSVQGLGRPQVHEIGQER
jgi:hypothetical protein